jgi:hypothetical protein
MWRIFGVLVTEKRPPTIHALFHPSVTPRTILPSLAEKIPKYLAQQEAFSVWASDCSIGQGKISSVQRIENFPAKIQIAALRSQTETAVHTEIQRCEARTNQNILTFAAEAVREDPVSPQPTISALPRLDVGPSTTSMS